MFEEDCHCDLSIIFLIRKVFTRIVLEFTFGYVIRITISPWPEKIFLY